MNVLVHLAEGFEEIEALTVVDVLRRAEIDTKAVSIMPALQVTGAHGIEVTADVMFDEANYEDCLMLVLPGGMPGTKNLGSHSGLVKVLQQFQREGRWIAAICAAPMIPGNLGMLQGRKATCYPGMEENLKGAVLSAERVVTDGNFITSRGPATALDFAYQIVEILKGKEIADELRRDMVLWA